LAHRHTAMSMMMRGHYRALEEQMNKPLMTASMISVYTMSTMLTWHMNFMTWAASLYTTW